MTAEEYLRGLRRALRVGPLARRRIVRELEAHLADTVAHELAAGATAAETERRAIARLGDPDSLPDFPARRVRPRYKLAAAVASIAVAGAAVALALVVPRGTSTPPTKVQRLARMLCGGANATDACVNRAAQSIQFDARQGWRIRVSGRTVILSQTDTATG